MLFIKRPPALLKTLSLSCLLSVISSPLYAQTTEGLSGLYYPERSFDVAPTPRLDPTINFNWGNSPPFEGFPNDRFQVRWRGWLVAQSTGWHTLSTRSDDGARLFVSGATLVDQWRNQGPTTHYGSPIWLDAGSAVPITVEYYEQGGGASMELRWITPNSPDEVIPQSALRPWEQSQSVGQPVTASFSRPFLWEGMSVATVRVSVARPHADLSEPLNVELTWEGEATGRFTGWRSSLTINANESTSGFNLTLIDNTYAEPTQQISVSVVGSEASPATLEVLDDDSADAPEALVMTGALLGLRSTDEVVMRATPLVREVVGNNEPVWREGEAVERYVVGERYSFTLPEGRYRIQGSLTRGEERLDLTPTEQTLSSLPESAMLYEREGVVVGVEVLAPPSLYALDFELKGEDELTAGAEAGAELTAGVEAGAELTAGAEAGAEPTAGAEAGAELTAGAEAGAELTAGLEAGAELTAGAEAGAELTAGAAPTPSAPTLLDGDSEVKVGCERHPTSPSPLSALALLLLMALRRSARSAPLSR